MARATPADAVDVELDAAELGPPVRVGRLFQRQSRAQRALSFEYSQEWLASRKAFALDPRLELYAGEQFAAGEATTFGVFLDSAPDRWGRVLLGRREALLASLHARHVRALTEWDYLLGVQDECRMGALRFRRDTQSPYLDAQPLGVPPVSSLRELEAISLALEKRGAETLPSYQQWLASLIAPGTSLGGSRPKANFREPRGALWIAKFPSREDRRDMAAWEKLLHDLAAACAIAVPDYALRRLGSSHHTFCTRRFDRLPHAGGQARRLFVSAMTLLERSDGQGGSYLDLAQFIQGNGARSAVAPDLEQLFRRVVFNVLTGNTDDHLRNHGFIRERTGWRLAPAYDLNPNPASRTHALRLDEANDTPDIAAILATASHYRLTAKKAARILDDTRQTVRSWKRRARAMKLPAAEIASVGPSFALAETD